MPTHFKELFIPTLREDPAEADTRSHKLLLRGGYIRQLAAGIYSLLPLGQRSLLKIIAIVREEMNAIGGQEFLLPALHPADLWRETGRFDDMGEILFRLAAREMISDNRNDERIEHIYNLAADGLITPAN